MAWSLRMTSPRGPRGMVRMYTQARRVALEAVGLLWFLEIFPEHFEESAMARYRYRKRTKKHDRAKRKRFGHERPNVFTGRLRDKMLGKMPRPRVTREGMSMSWRGLPRYAYMTDTMETVRTEDGVGKVVVVRRPDKQAELTAVNKADRVVLGRKFKDTFERRVKGEG